MMLFRSRRAWLGRVSPTSACLGATNGSPQHERSDPERVVAQVESYARLAGGFASLKPQPTLCASRVTLSQALRIVLMSRAEDVSHPRQTERGPTPPVALG